MWRCDPVMLRLELHGDGFMRRTLLHFAILIIICVDVRSATAGDKIDVPKVVTKSDAEKVLGVPVKMPRAATRTALMATMILSGVIMRSKAIRHSSSTFSMRGEKPRRILLRQCFPCFPQMAANRLVSTVLATKPFFTTTKLASIC